MRTLHAEPRTLGHIFQTDTVGVIWRVTAVTQEQNILVIGGIADWTWYGFLLFFGILIQPCERIKLGNLLLVFDFVLGQEGSCSSSFWSVI